MVITCRGCHNECHGVKSHIIPESFFRLIRGEENTLKIISNTPGEYAKKAPIGVYDTAILCRNCEKVFAKYDDYGARVLLNKDNLLPIEINGNTIGYRLVGIDTSLIKLFFVSVLWRASVSTMPFYQKVSLGKLEAIAKQMVWESDASSAHTFSFVLAKFSGEDSINKAMLDPHPERWFGVLYYRFYLAGYVLYIKASSSPTPYKFRKFISNNDELQIVNRGLLTASKEYGVLRTGNF